MPITVLRGFAIVLASGMAGAVLGAFIGYCLGLAAPDYYRTVFRIPLERSVDPIQIGVGLGLTQGLAGGVCVGTAIVLAVAWQHVRLAGRNSGNGNR